MSDNTAIEWADRPAHRVRATAAARLGISLAEYDENVAAGKKWCGGCRTWEPRDAFAADRSRGDGLMSHCRQSRNDAARSTYVPSRGPEPGRRFVAPRDGDQKQARRRVNYLVDAGLIPDPNELPCTDCGHVHEAGERRHEYDHHRGYTAEHHEDVEAVCTTCHHARENVRRAA